MGLLGCTLTVVGGGCRGPRGLSDGLILLNETPIQRLDPRFTTSTWDVKVSHLVCASLVSVDNSDGHPRMDLASAVRKIDPLTYVVTLNSAARFSDGQPVRARDVKYTFDSVRNPTLGSPYRRTWDEVLSSVETPTDAPDTIIFHLKAPRAPFMTDLDFGIVEQSTAEPVDRAVSAAVASGRSPPPFDSSREVIGAGPYKIAARPVDTIVLQENALALRRPRESSVTIRTIRDDNARFLALLGGSGDIIQNGIMPLVLQTFEQDPRLSIAYGRSDSLTYIGLNLDASPTSNALVRQAIALGIDRERIVAAKLRGHAVLATGLLEPKHPFYSGDVTRWPFDPARAKRLLDQAGFPDPDGDGPLPRMQLSWKTSANRFRVALAQIMARQLAAIGIEVDVRPFDFATFMDDIKKGNAQIFTLQANEIVEADMLRAFFHSSRIPTAAGKWAGLNRFRYKNADVDRWLNTGATAADDDTRRDVYAHVQKQLADDLPLIPLWHEDNVAAMRREVVGYQSGPNGGLGGLASATRH